MIYLVDGRQYHFSYNELQDDYYKYIKQSDDEFMQPANLIKALHFACIVLYFKDAGIEATVGDKGIIHQLVHLLDIPDEPLVDLQEVRKLFKDVLRLA